MSSEPTVSAEPIDIELDQISDRLRSWREERGLSRHELAELSGVAASTVHKVETRQMTPSIAVVLKLAHGLGRRPAELMADAHPPATLSLHRHSTADITATAAGSFERLTGELLAPEFEAWRCTFAPGTSSGQPLRFDGEVLLTCEVGELTLSVDDGDERILGAGDAAHFKASHPFAYRNDGGGDVRFVISATLPSDLRAVVRASTTSHPDPLDRSTS